MKRKSILMGASIICAASIFSQNIAYADDNKEENLDGNVLCESLLEDKLDSNNSDGLMLEDLSVQDSKKDMIDISYFNNVQKIINKKWSSFFCSKSKKKLYSELWYWMQEISICLKSASTSAKYEENIVCAQCIVSMVNKINLVLQKNHKAISCFTRLTTLETMKKYFSVNEILKEMSHSEELIAADHMIEYLESHYPDNNSILNFIQSTVNRFEILEAVMQYI